MIIKLEVVSKMVREYFETIVKGPEIVDRHNVYDTDDTRDMAHQVAWFISSGIRLPRPRKPLPTREVSPGLYIVEESHAMDFGYFYVENRSPMPEAARTFVGGLSI